MSANDSVTVPVTLTNDLIDRLVTLAVRLNRSSAEVAREVFERGLDQAEFWANLDISTMDGSGPVFKIDPHGR